MVCGNVQTANATVYIIDTVLMPAKWKAPEPPLARGGSGAPSSMHVAIRERHERTVRPVHFTDR